MRARREAMERERRENPGRFIGGADYGADDDEEGEDGLSPRQRRIRAKQKKSEEMEERAAAANRAARAAMKAEGRCLSIYEDPPTHWHALVMYVASSPLEHAGIRRLPLYTVLAYADDQRRREEIELKIMQAQAGMGPMRGLGKGRK